MTRNEAEKRIGNLMMEIREIYFNYNPGGDYLFLTVGKNYISAENAFHYGGSDHETPISIKSNLSGVRS